MSEAQKPRNYLEMSLREPLTWNKVAYLIKTYELDKLGRSESQLQAYHDFKSDMASKNIDLTTNLLINTMHWLPSTTDIHMTSADSLKLITYKDPRPFANTEDVYISMNEFPYFIKEKTLHLLIWVKFPMPPDPTSEIGDIDDNTKAVIDKYIRRNFIEILGIPGDKLLWWKNYTVVQSIKTIPHIHVLVNLDGDVNKTLERKTLGLVGTSGAVLTYFDTEDCKL